MLSILLVLAGLASGAQIVKPASLAPSRLSPALNTAAPLPALPVSAGVLSLQKIPALPAAPAVNPAVPGASALSPLALPPAAPGLAVPPPTAESGDGARAQTVAGALRVMAGSASQPASISNASAAQAFDGTRGVSSEAAPVDASPILPPNARGVKVDEVRSAAEINKLVPDGPIKNQLKLQIAKMAPYRLYTYSDANGKNFRAVDLSRNLQLVNLFPGLKPHEIKLIKKIQLRSKDLQILIRDDNGERHKTPDVVLMGLATELKSLFGPLAVLGRVIGNANHQVREHSQRHGLGHGAMAIDLTNYEQVPLPEVLAEIERWSRTKKGENALERIYVFAGRDLKVLLRQSDGSYQALDSEAQAALFEPRESAGASLPRFTLTAAPEAQPTPAVAAPPAAEDVNAERLLGRLRKLLSKNRLHDALNSWKSYQDQHGLKAREVESRVREVLPIVSPVKKVRLFAEHQANRIRKELEEPAKILVAAGIEATIMIYGSARVPEGSPSYEEARRFGALVATYGGGKIAVVTGGGGGVMAAGNRGAFEAGGPSIGYNIKLPHEQKPNPYVTPGLSYTFEHFHTRKESMRRPMMAAAYFEGGFGTLDELFEVLTLIQTGKMPAVPIVLVGKKAYWDQVLDFEHLSRAGLISPEDLSLFKFADTAEEAWAIIAASQDAK